MSIERTLNENVEELASNVTDIKTAIISKGVEVPENTPLSDYSAKVNQVYEAGENDLSKAMWDSILYNPTGTMYYKFIYWGAKTEEEAKRLFRPTKDLIPTRADYMFAWFYMPIDLKAQLDELGRVLDTSKCQYMTMLFYASYIKRIGKISLVSALPNYVTRIFDGASLLETIECLEFDGTKEYNLENSFRNAKELKNLTIEGEFIGNNFNVADCTLLTHDSLMSIINHLGTITTAKTVTLGSTNLAKLTDAEKAIATERGWTLA